MATGSHRGSGAATTDFLEEWKAKREKMRAKQAPPVGGPAAVGDAKATAAPASTANSGPVATELNNNNNGSGGMNCIPLARNASKEPPSPAGTRTGGAEPPGSKPSAAPSALEEEKVAVKGKSCSGPSARKGKGQIEKRKLREKRRSTGVVNIPATESLDEYDDDEAGQKERKREDAITQQNTMQNESSIADPSASYMLQDTSRTAGNRYKSTTADDEVSNRYSRTADRTGYNRYSRDANSSGNLVPTSSLEKKIEDLEKDLAKERQENQRLMRIAQDKEELIGKLKEEIDLLNRLLSRVQSRRSKTQLPEASLEDGSGGGMPPHDYLGDASPSLMKNPDVWIFEKIGMGSGKLPPEAAKDLDDIEDENEQLKQENKTLLKVVGQLTK